MGDVLLTLGDVVEALSVDRLASVLLGLGCGSVLYDTVLASDALLSLCNSRDSVIVKLSGMLVL